MQSGFYSLIFGCFLLQCFAVQLNLDSVALLQPTDESSDNEIDGPEWKACQGSVTQSLWQRSKNWKPPSSDDSGGGGGGGLGDWLSGSGNGSSASVPEGYGTVKDAPVASADASKAVDSMNQAKDNVQQQMEEVKPQLVPLDVSAEAERDRLTAAMGSQGTLFGEEMNANQLINHQGLLRGQMLTVRSGLQPTAHNRVVALNAVMQNLSYESPAAFDMLVKQSTNMDVQEFVIESEDVAAAQETNKMMEAFGASSFEQMDKSVAVEAGAAFGGAAVSVGVSKSKSESSSEEEASGSESSASSQKLTKTLMQSRYYLEPRFRLVVDKSMLTPDPEFNKESNQLARVLCKERGQQGCESQWPLDGAAKTELPSSSTICSADRGSLRAQSRAQRSLAHNLISKFGSHVCPQAVLGGWWRITALLKSKSATTAVDASKAASSAISSAASSSSGVSVGASFGGATLGVDSSKSESSGDAESSESASGSASQDQSENFDMEVNQSWRGGSSGVSLKEWRESLSKSRNSNLKIIDRSIDRCVGVWNFMADNYSACAVCRTWLEMFMVELGLDTSDVSKDELAKTCQSDGLMQGFVSKAMSSHDAKKNAASAWMAQQCISNNIYKTFVMQIDEIQVENGEDVSIDAVSFRNEGSSIVATPTIYYQRGDGTRDPSYRSVGKRTCKQLSSMPAADYDKCMRSCNAAKTCKFTESLSSGKCTLFSECSVQTASAGYIVADNVHEKPKVYTMKSDIQLVISFESDTAVDEFMYRPSESSDAQILRFRLLGDDGTVLLRSQIPYDLFGVADLYTQYGVPWMGVHGAVGRGRHWNSELGLCKSNQCYCRHAASNTLIEGNRGKDCPLHGSIDCPECCEAGQRALCATLSCESLGTQVNNPKRGNLPCSGATCDPKNAKDVAQCCMDKTMSTRYKVEVTACDKKWAGYVGKIDFKLVGASATDGAGVLTDTAPKESKINVDKGETGSFLYDVEEDKTVVPMKVCLRKTKKSPDTFCVESVTLTNPNLAKGMDAVGSAKDLFDLTDAEWTCASLIRQTASVAASVSATASRTPWMQPAKSNASLLQLSSESQPHKAQAHHHHVAHHPAVHHERNWLQAARKRRHTRTHFLSASMCTVYFYSDEECTGSAAIGNVTAAFSKMLQTFDLSTLPSKSARSLYFTETCGAVDLELVSEGASVTVGADSSKSSKCFKLATKHESIKKVMVEDDSCLCVVRFFGGSTCDSAEQTAVYSTSTFRDLNPASKPESCLYDDDSDIPKSQQIKSKSVLASAGCATVSVKRGNAEEPMRTGVCQSLEMTKKIDSIYIAGACADQGESEGCGNKTTWTSISWVTSGFNILQGNPFPTDGVLEGFGRPVWLIEYKAGTGSGDEGGCHPDGYDVKAVAASTFSTSSTLVASSKDYSNAVSSSFGFEAAGEAQGVSAGVSYSSDTSTEQSTAFSESKKLSITQASDYKYIALPRTGQSMPPIDPDFQHEVHAAFDQDGFNKIFNDFGTHYMSKVKMGARFYDKYYITESGFTDAFGSDASSSLGVTASYESGAADAAVGAASGSMSMSDSQSTGTGDSSTNEMSDRITTVVGGELSIDDSGNPTWVRDSDVDPLPIGFDITSICEHPAFLLADKVEACSDALTAYYDANSVEEQEPACVWDLDCDNDLKCFDGSCGEDPECEVKFKDDDGTTLGQWTYKKSEEGGEGVGHLEMPLGNGVKNKVTKVWLSGACEKIKLFDDDASTCSEIEASGDSQHVTKYQTTVGSSWSIKLDRANDLWDLKKDVCGFRVWVRSYDEMNR
eukprot:TRINITY_DN8543_c1_g4_i1.p1 TRINITY_DN8543_c1_g4~~TRINITY_DN8543_c1_g4_i1.p1  ORF type:complete len:1789 (+),score=267.48 TRINITY_DN8543_c1_g4_i1:101-5467(+)